MEVGHEQLKASPPRHCWANKTRGEFLLAAGITLPVLLLILGRLTGFPSITPIVQALAFYPLVAALTLVVAIVALVMRRWLTFSCVALVTVALAATSYPGAADSTTGSDERDRIRIVASNVKAGMATRALISTVTAAPVQTDILVVVECTDECARAVDAPAVRAMFPHQLIAPAPGPAGAAILSRRQLTRVPQRQAVGGHLAMPSVAIEIGQQTVMLQVAHPFPPLPFSLDAWRAGLADLAAYSQTTDSPIIMAGDFNATPYHAEFRAVLGERLSDAIPATAGTWPQALPPLASAPIDHILFSEPFSVADSGIWNLAETDHRAVWADLVTR